MQTKHFFYRQQKKVLSLENKYTQMTDIELRECTEHFREELRKGKTLNTILPEAFACVREAAFRVLSEKPYPVQILGGIVLHYGNIAEMQTGEGKTLTACLPAYLNALTGEGVHIVTVNPYLADRDKTKMEKLYGFLGLSTGLVIDSISDSERKTAYTKDIVYVTNDQLGFDYLKDHLAIEPKDRVQNGHAFAIVDEADSIFIDDARTPLIIAGKGNDTIDISKEADAFVRTLKKEILIELEKDIRVEKQIALDSDYVVDLKNKTVSLTAEGISKAEEHWNIETSISSPQYTHLLHFINQSLQAHGLMERDRDYVVKDDQIYIVDIGTGRIMEGRRFNDGLHQAIEAKENVTVKDDNVIQASVTYQHFFRLYKKLSGMTGTAWTEKPEFKKVYGLKVFPIPTNKKSLRIDHPLRLYLSEEEKMNALIEYISDKHATGQPILIGTTSVAKNERLAELLSSNELTFQLLNAKNDKSEAQIIASAGKINTITLATNMAGRGTDILLGGNPLFEAKAALDENEEVCRILQENELNLDWLQEFKIKLDTHDISILEDIPYQNDIIRIYEQILHERREACSKEAETVRRLGGLCVIGTELHENRRIDNQLKGRAGRQGDPGESLFFTSIEDDLLKIYSGKEFIVPEILKTGKETKNRRLKKHLINSQLRLENNHFESRKNMLRYDDSLNDQRLVLYQYRDNVMDGQVSPEIIEFFLAKVLKRYIELSFKGKHFDFAVLNDLLSRIMVSVEEDELNDFITNLPSRNKKKVQAALLNMLYNTAMTAFKKVEDACTSDDEYLHLKKAYILANLDAYWMLHLQNMDRLKKGIFNRSYGMNDPAVQYALDGNVLFEEMLFSVQEGVLRQMVNSYRVVQESVCDEEN